MQDVELQRLLKRQKAAQLLLDVVDERMEPRLAINTWPETLEAPDASLDVAYQALWYFEADEERHRTEMFYLDAQLELLRQMADFLAKGHDLPGYMQRMYLPNQQARFYYARSFGNAGVRFLRLQWTAMLRLWRQVWLLWPSSGVGRKGDESESSASKDV